MAELQRRLEKRDTPVNFHHTKNRVRCFAHIINICSSHLVSAMSGPSSKQPNYDFYELDSDDELGTTCDEVGDTMATDSDDSDTPATKSKRPHPWDDGIKRNPLMRARKLVRFLRASDQRKTLLQRVIKDGNERSWFYERDKDGNDVPTILPQLQLLKDVKTRWDSVFMMLNRLIELRGVSHSTTIR
jgi:hypothetical protein